MDFHCREYMLNHKDESDYLYYLADSRSFTDIIIIFLNQRLPVFASIEEYAKKKTI